MTDSINSLPNELLAYIFALCAVGEDIPYRSRRGVSDHRWIHLTLVCRYWRDVAHTTPTLWAKIIVGRKAEWLQLCLTRSASTALDIVFTSGAFPSPQLELGVLLLHAHRIRTLRLDILVVREEWHAVLCRLLCQPMPALEELHYKVLGTHDDLAISSERFPRLEVLHLVGATAPRDTQTYSKLSSLRLKDCSCDLTYDQFLDALSGSETLQELHLDCFLDRLAFDTQPSTDARLTLPRLSDLTLRNHRPAKSNMFVGHLVLPSLTRLKVHCYLGSIEEHDLTQTLPKLLPPDPGAYFPLLREITSVGLRVREDCYQMTGFLDDRGMGRPNIQLSVTSDPYVIWGETFPIGLRDVLDVFRDAPLRHLLVYHGDYEVDVDPTLPWATLLRSFPMLETLKVDGWEWVTGLWQGLGFASCALEANPDVPDLVGPGSVVCPGLHTMRLGYWLFVDERMLDEIAECLRVRADRGTRLRRLYMTLSYHSSVYVQKKETAVSRLQKLVGEVSVRV
ncbi:hypothetical protein C8Q74DRAFT_1304416 [Fomes fomentarius]|nr:hypothetical protein C8Q74DRAFT_1304416 [Fomes fomentarius]